MSATEPTAGPAARREGRVNSGGQSAGIRLRTSNADNLERLAGRCIAQLPMIQTAHGVQYARVAVPQKRVDATGPAQVAAHVVEQRLPLRQRRGRFSVLRGILRAEEKIEGGGIAVGRQPAAAKLCLAVDWLRATCTGVRAYRAAISVS